MTTLGRYEILDKIGAGSMGTVYRANDTVLDRHVALKTIRTGSEVEPELRERFYREAKACARLQHPGIVTVYDLGEIDRTAYIAMEMLVGSDFRKLIDEHADISLDIKIRAMAEVCEALGHAHRHGIIHRDVKPSNLFLTENQHAKVLDFGIARLPSSRLTVAGRILGTPNYMAPEQILAKPTDTRSDLFSAAVVFFELLVFVHPFHGDLIPKRVVDGQPDSLFDHNSNLPLALDKIFSRALALDPARRYRTGDEFAGDLRALLDVMRQNASPTFSRVQLPSDRELLPTAGEPAPAADPSLLREPPAGEDPHEWRLSEVLRLIPEFEDAIERNDGVKARQVCRQLEAIEAVDSRFADALVLCHSRLKGIKEAYTSPAEPAFRPVQTDPPPPPAAADPPILPKMCGHCGASNRGSASNCIACGATLVSMSAPAERINPAPAPVEHPAVEVDDSVTSQFRALKPPHEPPPARLDVPVIVMQDPAPAPARRFIPTPPQAVLFAGPRRKQQIAIIGGGAALILLLVVVLMLTLRQPSIERSLATAVIASPTAALYRNPDVNSGSVATLSKGDRVNVLRLPRDREQEWVQSQFVSPASKVSRPGYLQVRDLDPEKWDSPDPLAKLDLIRVFYAGESGDDAGIQAEIGALRRLESQFPDSMTSREAELELARLELALIRHLKDAGQPPETWMSRLESIRQHLRGASVEPSLSSDIDLVQQGVDELSAVKTAPPPALPAVRPVAPRPVEPPKPVAEVPRRPAAEVQKAPSRSQADDLADAQRLLDEPGDPAKQLANLMQAEKLVDRVLKEQPGNPKALQLQAKIKRVKAVLE